MKRLITLLFALIIVGALPLALAIQGEGARGNGTDAPEDCLARMQAQYPDADADRLAEKCAQLRVAAELREEKAEQYAEMMKLRSEYRERLLELNDEHAEKMAQLRYEYLRKLSEMDREQLEKVANLSSDELEKFAKLDRARIAAFAEKSPDELREALHKVTITKVKKEDAYRKRVLEERQLRMADDDYDNATIAYERSKEMFHEYQRQWKDAVKDGNETAAIEYAKEYLGHAADMIIGSLEKVRARIEGDDDLTDEEAQAALADIDEKIAVMESLQEELADAQTKDEVKAVGKKILNAWEGMKHALKVHAELVVRTQVGEIMSRSESLERHLDRILAEMEEEGIDVDELDGMLDEFSQLIASARDKFEDSQELFEEAKVDGDRDALENSKTLAREAHADLQAAHALLMDIVREVKRQGYDVEDDDDYVEIVEEDEEELEDDDALEEDEEELEDDDEDDASEEDEEELEDDEDDASEEDEEEYEFDDE